MAVTEGNPNHRAWKPAKGSHAAGQKSPKIGIVFPQDVFDAIRERAAKRGVSFASEVRRLVIEALDA